MTHCTNDIIRLMNTDIAILHEDENLVVINKPAGLIVHNDGKREEETVVDWFISRYPESANVGEEPIETEQGALIKRPGVVHRLDRDTSGVLVLCKTDAGHEHIKKQFQGHSVQKTYVALVYGDMKKEAYHVSTPIGRARTFGRWTAIPKAIRGRTRDSETYIEVKKHFQENNQEYCLIEAKPKTGRTHQIRVHLQYLNHPIVADVLYAGKRNEEKYNLGFKRQALHAFKLELENLDGNEIVFRAPVTNEFTKYV